MPLAMVTSLNGIGVKPLIRMIARAPLAISLAKALDPLAHPVEPDQPLADAFVEEHADRIASIPPSTEAIVQIAAIR